MGVSLKLAMNVHSYLTWIISEVHTICMESLDEAAGGVREIERGEVWPDGASAGRVPAWSLGECIFETRDRHGLIFRIDHR